MLDLPDESAERRLVRRAENEGLLLDGLARCYDGPPARYGVTLGYAGPGSCAELAAASSRLTSVLADMPVVAPGPPGHRE